MAVENYVGRCPECDTIIAVARMPIPPDQIGRFAVEVLAMGRVLGTATNAEVWDSPWVHAAGCKFGSSIKKPEGEE